MKKFESLLKKRVAQNRADLQSKQANIKEYEQVSFVLN